MTPPSSLSLQHPEHWQAFVREGAAAMGIPVTEDQTRQFFLHAEELARWNRKTNLTTITDPREVAVKHFLDAIVPAPRLEGKAKVLDLGTGGGFPGLPLKIIRPSLHVTLVDASARKINFARQVIRLLELQEIEAVQVRAESLADQPAFAEAFDVVISRAFSSLGYFVRVAAPLVRAGGQLIAMKGAHFKPELDLLGDLSLPWEGREVCAGALFSVEVHSYCLYHLGDNRSLIFLTRRAG